jgi:chromosome segregation ATPase
MNENECQDCPGLRAENEMLRRHVQLLDDQAQRLIREGQQALRLIAQTNRRYALEHRRNERVRERVLHLEETVERLESEVERLRATRRRPDPSNDECVRRIFDYQARGLTWPEICAREHEDKDTLKKRIRRWRERQGNAD